MVLVMLENVDVGSDFVVSILSKKLKREQGVCFRNHSRSECVVIGSESSQ